MLPLFDILLLPIVTKLLTMLVTIIVTLNKYTIFALGKKWKHLQELGLIVGRVFVFLKSRKKVVGRIKILFN